MSWIMGHGSWTVTHYSWRPCRLVYWVKLCHQKKFHLNWFSGLEVTDMSWIMGHGSWTVNHDPWRPCRLVYWVKLCHQKKFQLNWFNGLGVTAKWVEQGLLLLNWAPASLYGLSPLGIALLNKRGTSPVKEVSLPLTGRLTTSLKGFYALAAWEREPTSSSPTQVVQHSKTNLTVVFDFLVFLLATWDHEQWLLELYWMFQKLLLDHVTCGLLECSRTICTIWLWLWDMW